jgi:hypothetical protein
LLKELEDQHNKVKKLLNSLDKKKFSESIKWRFSSYMPTLLDIIVFMCVNNGALHLGQLAAWRRAMGLNSALGTL